MHTGATERLILDPSNEGAQGATGDLRRKVQEELATIVSASIAHCPGNIRPLLMLGLRLHISAIHVILHRSVITREEIAEIYSGSDPIAAASDIEPDLFGVALAVADEMIDILTSDEGDNEEMARWNQFCRSLTQEGASSYVATLIDDCLGIDMRYRRLMHFLLRYLFSNAHYSLDPAGRGTVINMNRATVRLYHLLNIARAGTICRKIDDLPIGDDSREIRLFAIARNESARLPFFLEYYSRLGVDRFFLIDNDSTDNSREIALGHKNLHLFKIDEGYRKHWYWMEYLLGEYGVGHWCMVVDIDELFSFPLSERVLLRDMISYLEANHYTAVKSVLIDIYSDKPIAETDYSSTKNPLEVCRFFDNKFLQAEIAFLDKKRWTTFYSMCHFGGVRTRIFGKENELDFCLSKVSLIKYSAEVYLVQGMHAVNGAVLADIEGAVMHTKLFQDFIEKASLEAKREEHFANGFEYKLYDKRFQDDRHLTLTNEESVEYKGGTPQLAALGIMKYPQRYLAFLENVRRPPEDQSYVSSQNGYMDMPDISGSKR